MGFGALLLSQQFGWIGITHARGGLVGGGAHGGRRAVTTMAPDPGGGAVAGAGAVPAVPPTPTAPTPTAGPPPSATPPASASASRSRRAGRGRTASSGAKRRRWRRNPPGPRSRRERERGRGRKPVRKPIPHAVVRRWKRRRRRRRRRSSSSSACEGTGRGRAEPRDRSAGDERRAVHARGASGGRRLPSRRRCRVASRAPRHRRGPLSLGHLHAARDPQPGADVWSRPIQALYSIDGQTVGVAIRRSRSFLAPSCSAPSSPPPVPAANVIAIARRGTRRTSRHASPTAKRCPMADCCGPSRRRTASISPRPRS